MIGWFSVSVLHNLNHDCNNCYISNANKFNIELILCQTFEERTNGCPSSNRSKTEVLACRKLHIEHGHSTEEQHDQVRHKERPCSTISSRKPVTTTMGGNVLEGWAPGENDNTLCWNKFWGSWGAYNEHGHLVSYYCQVTCSHHHSTKNYCTYERNS